jgi:hypothetical protein
MYLESSWATYFPKRENNVTGKNDESYYILTAEENKVENVSNNCSSEDLCSVVSEKKNLSKM